MSAIWLCSITLLFALCRSVAASSDYSDFSTEDIFIPAQCDSIAKPGDHLLLEYTAKFANGSTASYLKKPSQLYHVLLDQSVSNVYFEYFDASTVNLYILQ